MNTEKPALNWRIEGHITLALVVTILVQTSAALMWAGAAAERISQLERRTANQGAVAERLARLEEQMAQARASLTRIEERVSR